MASIARDKNGRRRVLIVDKNGKRQTIRIGLCSLADARTVAAHIDELNAAVIQSRTPVHRTVEWASEVGNILHDRLARVGLVEPRAKRQTTLAAFFDDYLETRNDVKPGTMAVMKQARRHVVNFLGERKPLSAVTPADADRFRSDLLAKGRARATVAKWCHYARHYFEQAKRARLIEENPFAHIRGQVRGNTARRVFVPAAEVHKVMKAAPDPQWKLLIALARWGGLRIPSEALALTWGDVDFERGRFTVHASKTEHHEAGGVRVVPMFPELAPHFQAVFDDAPEGSEYVITRYRNPAANLRTQLVRYIKAAGLVPWAKPWQNMRASRATELADEYPGHVCSAWLGHSEKVADEFYRSVTDDHFQRATAAAPEAAQNPAQQTREMARKSGKPESDDMQKPREIQGFARDCAKLRTEGLGAAGIEQSQELPGNEGISDRRGTISGARDPDLARLMDRWPTLPAAIRVGILAIIDAAEGRGKVE